MRCSYADRVTPRAATRRMVTLLVGAFIAVVLVACYSPPAGASEALDDLETRVRELPGVESVETSLSQRDPKDHPDEWIAAMHVIAEQSDLDLAGDIRLAVGGGIQDVTMAVSVAFPERAGVAATVIDPSDFDSVELAAELRVLPAVESIAFAGSQRYVGLTDVSTFSDAVAALQAVGVGEPLTLAKGDAFVSTDGRDPSGALLELIDEFASDDSTAYLSYSARGPDQSRSSLVIESSDYLAIADVLASTADEAADSGTAPRTAFTVRQSAGEGAVTGWVGLPLGSDEPDDLSEGDPGSAAVVPNPAELPDPEPRPEAEDAVRQFLQSASDSTGVAAQIATRTERCPDGVGVRAAGAVVIPVFDLYESADEPFARVIDAWSQSGLQRTDRAMGRDVWTSGLDDPGAVSTASIRGTTEGLSITAETGCAIER